MMQHQHQNQAATSFLKVELKHFILSILDDPIVSRVFAEAGFRSYDIKLALLQPPLPSSSSSSRFFSRPVFLCNLEPVQPGSALDDDCRRIVEVLLRKNQRNPLLMGAYAKSALRSFIETVRRGGVLLPSELSGLSVVCVEKEIAEFVSGSGSGEKMALRFKELSFLVEQCKGCGVVVSFGEIEVFVGDGGVGFVVEHLTRLLQVHGGKVWLLGVAGTSDAYSKFLGLFPTVDKDWDLQLLTMTCAKPSMEGLYSSKSRWVLFFFLFFLIGSALYFLLTWFLKIEPLNQPMCFYCLGVCSCTFSNVQYNIYICVCVTC